MAGKVRPKCACVAIIIRQERFFSPKTNFSKSGDFYAGAVLRAPAQVPAQPQAGSSDPQKGEPAIGILKKRGGGEEASSRDAVLLQRRSRPDESVSTLTSCEIPACSIAHSIRVQKFPHSRIGNWGRGGRGGRAPPRSCQDTAWACPTRCVESV